MSFGCASEEPADPGDDDGGSSGSSNAGSSNAGSTASGGAASGGSAGTAGSSAGSNAAGGSGAGQAGSAGSSPATGCAGVFGAPALVFAGGSEAIPQSLSVTGDDLELYYQENRVESQHVLVRKRASRDAPFGPPSELSPALFTWCPTPQTQPNVDVSDDGLRLYMTCNPDMGPSGEYYPPGPIRLAARPDRNSDFTLLPDVLGTAGISISVSPDELTAVSTDLAVIEMPRTLLSVRASLDVPFGAAVEVTGGNGSPFRHPEFVGDSFTLFGAWENNGTYPARLALRRRSNLDPHFGEPETEGLPFMASVPPVTISDLTPTVSADCRSVYFLRMGQTDPNGYAFDVYAAKR